MQTWDKRVRNIQVSPGVHDYETTNSRLPLYVSLHHNVHFSRRYQNWVCWTKLIYRKMCGKGDRPAILAAKRSAGVTLRGKFKSIVYSQPTGSPRHITGSPRHQKSKTHYRKSKTLEVKDTGSPRQRYEWPWWKGKYPLKLFLLKVMIFREKWINWKWRRDVKTTLARC